LAGNKKAALVNSRRGFFIGKNWLESESGKRERIESGSGQVINVVWAEEGGLAANDRGLAYGDGLFETIRMQGQLGALLGRHQRRLLADAERLGIMVAHDALSRACRLAAERYAPDFDEKSDAHSGTGGWVLKLILSRGPGGRGYRPDSNSRPQLLISAGPLPSLPPVAGVVADIARQRLTVNPQLAGMKTLNRLEQVMAARELTDGVFELIMRDHNDCLVEGTRTNLLVKTTARWITPPATALAVDGVMRQWVLDCLRRRGEPVLERSLRMADLRVPVCEGLYLLSSVLGVVPVYQLADAYLPVTGGLATICDLLTTLE
jgi:4-amino-4-deoxychorismate lyase